MVVVCVLIRLVEYIILIRAILYWLSLEEKNEFTRLMVTITEPILKPVRALVPPLGNGIDLSPIVIFLLLHIASELLCK